MASNRHTPKLEPRPYRHWMPMIEAICERHGVSWSEVLSGYRDRRIAACRHEIWAELYANSPSSLATIGRRTGGYHHSTVLAAVHKVRAAHG